MLEGAQSSVCACRCGHRKVLESSLSSSSVPAYSAGHDKSKVKVLGGLAPPEAALLDLWTGPSPDVLMWLSLSVLCPCKDTGHIGLGLT